MVRLWSTETGLQLAYRSYATSTALPAVGGALAFNCDGSRLAACVTEQRVPILDGMTLEEISTPYLAQAQGGTAVAWHPTVPEFVVAGDSKGSLRADTPAGHHFFTIGPLPDRIVGLAFSPDARRVAEVSVDGTCTLTDHRWGAGTEGQLLMLKSDRQDASGLLFDPTGGRLALIHRDGTILIWETGLPAIEGKDARSRWVEVPGTSHARLFASLRAQATAVDDRGRPYVLYARTNEVSSACATLATSPGMARRGTMA